MKKLLVLGIFLISISFVFYLYINARQVVRNLSSPFQTANIVPTDVVPTEKPIQEFSFNEKTYQFYFHKIENDENLTLISNFENIVFSAQIVKNEKCDFGINGGFYKKEGGPLGFFQIDDKKIGEQIQSPTFNGFFAKKKNGIFTIYNTFDLPTDYIDSLSFIFQSGPLIYIKRSPSNFIEEDFSRRSLIAKTEENEFYLFSIFEKDNVFNGPRLKDLQNIFLSDKLHQIADFDLLLNLDGGSASAFYDKDVQVEEFKPIGSFLCGKSLP